MVTEDMDNLMAQIVERMKEKDISVEKLSQVSGVSDRYIKLLLEGNTEKLPPAPYIRGYIKKIAEALKLDSEALWKEFQKRHETIRQSGVLDKLPPNRFEKKSRGRKVFIALLILIPLTLLGFARLSYTKKPTLILENLKNEVTIVSKEKFTIQGTIDSSYTLRINSEQVLIDEEGAFTQELILTPGFNTITFKASRLLTQEYRVVKQILYEKPEPEIIPQVISPTGVISPATSTNGKPLTPNL